MKISLMVFPQKKTFWQMGHFGPKNGSTSWLWIHCDDDDDDELFLWYVLALFPAGTIVKDHHHLESLTYSE